MFEPALGYVEKKCATVKASIPAMGSARSTVKPVGDLEPFGFDNRGECGRLVGVCLVLKLMCDLGQYNKAGYLRDGLFDEDRLAI